MRTIIILAALTLNGCVTINNNNYPNQKTPPAYVPDFCEEVLDPEKEVGLY